PAVDHRGGADAAARGSVRARSPRAPTPRARRLRRGDRPRGPRRRPCLHARDPTARPAVRRRIPRGRGAVPHPVYRPAARVRDLDPARDHDVGEPRASARADRRRRPRGQRGPESLRHPAHGRRRPGARALLFILLFVSFAYFYQAGGWNQNSRFDLVRAITNEGTLNIDPFMHSTGDKAFSNGHYYSDKAPGIALAAVPVVAVARPI